MIFATQKIEKSEDHESLKWQISKKKQKNIKKQGQKHYHKKASLRCDTLNISLVSSLFSLNMSRNGSFI